MDQYNRDVYIRNVALRKGVNGAPVAPSDPVCLMQLVNLMSAGSMPFGYIISDSAPRLVGSDTNRLLISFNDRLPHLDRQKLKLWLPNILEAKPSPVTERQAAQAWMAGAAAIGSMSRGKEIPWKVAERHLVRMFGDPKGLPELRVQRMIDSGEYISNPEMFATALAEFTTQMEAQQSPAQKIKELVLG